jgi:2-polyprenyl-6-methoxyphenol hydroxylase-like FAD-dependent oxidoreductase
MVVKAVAVVGAGHVGVPHAITLALKCPSIRVTIVDTDKRKVAAWKCVAAGLPNPRLFCCQSCC